MQCFLGNHFHLWCYYPQHATAPPSILYVCWLHKHAHEEIQYNWQWINFGGLVVIFTTIAKVKSKICQNVFFAYGNIVLYHQLKICQILSRVDQNQTFNISGTTSTINRRYSNIAATTATCTCNSQTVLLTSTLVLPLKPKSWSLNGRPSRVSAVSSRYCKLNRKEDMNNIACSTQPSGG